jgi:hypothetical protein
MSQLGHQLTKSDVRAEVRLALIGGQRLMVWQVSFVPRAVKEEEPVSSFCFGQSPYLFRDFALTSVDEAVAKLE